MATLKLNNTEFEISEFNRTTYYTSEELNSNANVIVENTTVSALETLAHVEITSLQIINNGEVIYNLQNISATLDTINEYLKNGHMEISIGINFNI